MKTDWTGVNDRPNMEKSEAAGGGGRKKPPSEDFGGRREDKMLVKSEVLKKSKD